MRGSRVHASRKGFVSRKHRCTTLTLSHRRHAGHIHSHRKKIHFRFLLTYSFVLLRGKWCAIFRSSTAVPHNRRQQPQSPSQSCQSCRCARFSGEMTFLTWIPEEEPYRSLQRSCKELPLSRYYELAPMCNLAVVIITSSYRWSGQCWFCSCFGTRSKRRIYAFLCCVCIEMAADGNAVGRPACNVIKYHERIECTMQLKR